MEQEIQTLQDKQKIVDRFNNSIGDGDIKQAIQLLREILMNDIRVGFGDKPQFNEGQNQNRQIEQEYQAPQQQYRQIEQEYQVPQQQYRQQEQPQQLPQEMNQPRVENQNYDDLETLYKKYPNMYKGAVQQILKEAKFNYISFEQMKDYMKK